jgi:regulator of protease activity HflC (stomatin/prohibitin superfamily)
MDLRVVTIDVARQEVMTRDDVPMTVDAVLYFRVIDPASAVVRVENYLESDFVHFTDNVAQRTRTGGTR